MNTETTQVTVREITADVKKMAKNLAEGEVIVTVHGVGYKLGVADGVSGEDD